MSSQKRTFPLPLLGRLRGHQDYNLEVVDKKALLLANLASASAYSQSVISDDNYLIILIRERLCVRPEADRCVN